MNKFLRMLTVITSIGFASAIAPLSYAAEPLSKCITAGTTATHANVTARMEKDIAPYAQSANAAPIIKKYQDGMTVAWNALQEPYCGYGSYGPSSAVKSYSKSVERARTTFLSEIKNIAKTKTVTVSPQIVSAPLPTATVSPVAPVVINTVTPTSVSSNRIFLGLQLGMRSTSVTQLQRTLTSYFHLPADTSSITGYFGPKTEALVKRFQLEKKIISSNQAAGAGRVGPKTAAALNAR